MDLSKIEFIQIFEKARTTGIWQQLTYHFDYCDGSVRACKCDFVTIWALPNGKMKTTRYHCYRKYANK